MRQALQWIGVSVMVYGCHSSATVERGAEALLLVAGADTVIAPTITDSLPKPYSHLEYSKTELLHAAPGTKSVLFNTNGSRLYAMNLEGMSVYEFDQPSRKVIREFKFKPTKGTGWNYVTDKPIPSYQEKPVEACFSHDDKILWVSLHNAEGIVPIWVDSIKANMSTPATDMQGGHGTKKQISKRIRVIYPGQSQKDSFDVPLIITGKTPKIISRTADSKYLLVSNWHSYDVSILEMNENEYPYAKVISTVPVSSIPRGIAVDDKAHRSFVAIMGGASITVINNTAWMKETDISVESNPRHIVLDTSGHLFVSYNKLAKIACIDAETGKTLFTAPTHAQPRTIILSKNHKFLFVTCYNSDYVDVFKITDNGFKQVASLPCKGHPVGVDVFEDNDTLEAWVCSYSNGSISVFSFAKK
ncbi:MAG: YncE family protein [Chitinophagaceae bacterium]|nr:YncE family protein [Chitinophagaceae bacterium]